jgi:hypothetical protein
VDVVTRSLAAFSEIEFLQGQGTLLSSETSIPATGTIQPPTAWEPSLGVKLPTLLHLVPRLRMSAAVRPLPLCAFTTRRALLVQLQIHITRGSMKCRTCSPLDRVKCILTATN